MKERIERANITAITTESRLREKNAKVYFIDTYISFICKRILNYKI